jgi:hypothetical protein
MVIFKGILAVSAEQETFGIPYQTLPWKRKQLRIPFRGTKIEAKRSKLSELPSELFHGRENNSEFLLCFCGTKTEANSRNSLLNPSGEEKTTQTSI